MPHILARFSKPFQEKYAQSVTDPPPYITTDKRFVPHVRPDESVSLQIYGQFSIHLQ